MLNGELQIEYLDVFVALPDLHNYLSINAISECNHPLVLTQINRSFSCPMVLKSLMFKYEDALN